MAEQFGLMLDALFMEGLQADLERLARINSMLAHARPGPAPLGMRHVETLLLQPEEDPAETALIHQAAVPGTLRSLLRVLGARGSRGGRLLSFLLFESPFTQALIHAGERDANRRRTEISAFLGLDAAYGAQVD